MWLLSRVVDGAAPVRPRMKDARSGEPIVAELRGTLPHEPTPLAASLERAPPQVGHTEPERCQALGCREATKLNQAGLVRMERQLELLKSRAHRIKEATGVALVLEADDHIIGIAHDDHVASSLTPSPALGPQIQDVVEVDIGEEGRNYRPLPRPPLVYGQDPVF